MIPFKTFQIGYVFLQIVSVAALRKKLRVECKVDTGQGSAEWNYVTLLPGLQYVVPGTPTVLGDMTGVTLPPLQPNVISSVRRMAVGE